MSYQSPMMKRVKSTHGTKSILPRKGLIRSLLIIIGIVVGVNLVVSFVNKIKTDKPKTVKKENDSKAKKAENRKKDKEKNNQDNNVPLVKYDFSFEDVSRIAQSNANQFAREVDTIKEKNKLYTVHYSVDSSLQALGNRLFKQYHPKYASVVAIDPVTGRVLSLVSYTNDSVPVLANDLYCRSIFPSASVFKTVTASAAIEKAGYSSESIVRHVGKKSTLYKYQLTKELSNFTELPFEEAYAHSINAVFARIAMFVLGESTVLDFGNRLGFNASIPFELPCEISTMKATDSTCNLAELASGFNECTRMSPLLGALIGGAICENGRVQKPVLVDSLTTNDNQVVYRSEKEVWRTPLREGTARELRQMMHEVAIRGTARKSFKLIRQTSSFDTLEYGGKTGSVDKDTTGRVDWFVGFVKNPVKKNERMSIGVVTVHGANWTVHSSYIAAEYFRSYIGQIRKKEKLRNDSLKAAIVARSDSQ